MNLVCRNCGHTFVHDAGKPRCPSCLRQHGLDPEPSAEERSPCIQPRRRRYVIAIAVVAVAAALLAFAGYRFSGGTSQRPISQAPAQSPAVLKGLTTEALRDVLSRRGVPPEDQVAPFELSEDAGELLNEIHREASDEVRLRQVIKSLSARLGDVVIDTGSERRIVVRDAATFGSELVRGQVKRALSFEVAVLATALLRGVGLHAVVTYLHLLDAPTASASVDALVGRFGVSLLQFKDTQGEMRAIDPSRSGILPEWAGGGGDETMRDLSQERTPLSDEHVVSQLLALRAVALLKQHEDAGEQADEQVESGKRAFALVQSALRVAEPTSLVRFAYARVLLQVGGVREAMNEAKKGAAWRGEPAGKLMLAVFYLEQGYVEQARIALNEAIKLDVGFWPAYIQLAELEWLAGNQKEGDDLLEKAAGIARDAPDVMMLSATRRMRQGDFSGAVSLYRTILDKRPSDQTRLLLYLALIQGDQQTEADAVRTELLRESDNPEKVRKALDAVEASLNRQHGKSPGEQPPRSPARTRLKLPDVTLTP